jgi:hypothetical protein
MMPSPEMGVLASLIPLFIMSIPFVILNAMIAARKGKSSILFGLLSVLPVFSLFLFLYLISKTDKEINDKLDHIIKLLPHS